jgi:hypothetical protein
LAWLRRRLLLTTWKVGSCEGSDNNVVVLVLLGLKLLLEEMSCWAEKMLMEEKSMLL